MSEQQADVLVVGAGIMGASAAWHLARRGLRVTVLEQFDLGHVRGSSHGASRIFRLAYDQLDYVRLAQEALPLWREAEGELRKDLLWTTGGLDVGPARDLSPIAAALSMAGVFFERLSRAELARRFPAYKLPEAWEALYQTDTGVVYADDARLGFLELARRSGAEIRPCTSVTNLAPREHGVSVETGDGRWHASVAVVTAASWSNRLLAPLGLAVPLTVTREHVAYYPYLEGQRLVPFICHEEGSSFDELYGLPNGARRQIKVGLHKTGPEVDPDSEAVLEESRIQAISDAAQALLPSLDAQQATGETCLYASTPDDDFVIDRPASWGSDSPASRGSGSLGPIVLGIGFGGHGFKFGAVIGKLLADLVEGKPIPFGQRFSHRRFTAHTIT